MTLVKNFDELATSPARKVALEIIEAGLAAIQPEEVIGSQFTVHGSQLDVSGQKFDLDQFERVFLVGFGKGSAEISRLIEEKLGERLTAGWDIDVRREKGEGRREKSKINFVEGTHPLPSEKNVEFTKMVVGELEGRLTEEDLVLVVVCGGGSALFTWPHCSIATLLEVNRALLKSGATIEEMNTVRKKLDKVKGGGLARILYPARVVSLVFSDVPGNNLATIASGPTVEDPTTVEEALGILGKLGNLGIRKEDLVETPKEGKFFEKVNNILSLSNRTALDAVEKKGREWGLPVRVVSSQIQGEARRVGADLVREIKKEPGRAMFLAGGETTVAVKGEGQGGRNQEVVLGGMRELLGEPQDENILIASVASDGWDNGEFAGAIGDEETRRKAESAEADPEYFLENNDSYGFFEKTGDGIVTGRLPSNVSDLMIVLKS